jgi:hypothetical protein
MFLLVLFAFPVAAQTPEPGWIADATSGCRVWNTAPQPNESISWTGACRNNLAQGHGVLQWSKDGKPGSRYEGEYRDGNMNGHGVYTWARGDRYDGEYHDGKRDGHGAYMWANGDRYDGEYRDGKAHGIGTKTLADTSTYTGTWMNGCFKQGSRWATVGATVKECGFE